MRHLTSLITLTLLLLAVTPGQAQSVAFTTQPAARSIAGYAYSYDADAGASDGSSLRYSLSYGPTGMIVDGSSGLVTWTPQNTGTYAVEIRAALDGNPATYANQSWSLNVAAAPDPFSVSCSPDWQALNGATATYSVEVIVLPSYTASVFMSAYSPTLPGATFTFKPSTVNGPYPSNCVMTVTLTGPKTPGTHQIVIEGKNGPSTARDTVMLTVGERPAWQVFDIHNSSLPNNTVTALAIDRNGVGWIGTYAGLASFDGATWTIYDSASGFPLYRKYEFDDDSRVLISGIAIDSSNNVWVVNDMGLARYSNGTWRGYGLQVSVLGWSRPNKIAADNSGNVWIAGDDALVKFDGTAFTRYPMDSPLDRIVSVATDPQGNVWAGDLYTGTVRRFDGDYWTVYDDLPVSFHKDASLAVDTSGIVWSISPDGGAVRFDRDTIVVFRAGRDHTDSFPGENPQAMDFDGTGTAWVGQETSGLLRFDGTNTWQYTIGNSGLPGNTVTVVRAAANRMIWVGTEGGGLAILDGTAPGAALLSVRQERTAALAQHHLTGIAPNPAQERALVDLDLPTSSHVRLSVVNTLGEEVAVVIDGEIEPGHHQVQIDLATLRAGTYFLRLDVAGAIEAQPLVIAR